MIFISAVVSLVFAFFTSSITDLNNEILSAPEKAVGLSFKLLGSMAFWGGVLRVAEKSGLVAKISQMFRPLLKRLFVGVDENGEAFGAIVMNITANLMGLGNAATPLGIRAICELSKEQSAKGTATKSMVAFVVINTASIQLIPTTVATLRASHGSMAPMEILPACLVSAVCALTVGLTLVFLLDRSFIGRGRGQ